MVIMTGQVESMAMAGAHRAPRRQPAETATRRAILDAASALFAERGYVATTVDDIALAAQVQVRTVYIVVGDKAQLLEAVVNRFVGDPTAVPAEPPEPDPTDEPAPATGEPSLFDETNSTDATLRLSSSAIAVPTGHRSVIRTTVHANRLATEAFADFYDLIHRNGKTDDTIAGGAAAAEDRMRRSAQELAERLATLNVLRVGVPQAVDLLAYFLGYLSWRRLVNDFGWSYDDAETWLADRIGEALLLVEG